MMSEKRPERKPLSGAGWSFSETRGEHSWTDMSWHRRAWNCVSPVSFLPSLGWSSRESDTTERLHFHSSLSCIGEGNGNPLQCSCLENPRDGGAWWAAVYGVAQSRTRLNRLSSSSSRMKLEGIGNPLQCSCLENPMDRGAWWAAVHGVAKSRTRLSDFTFTFHFHALEEEMATHTSVLAWRIPGTVESGGLLSMGSHRVRHDWSDLAAAAARIYY